MPRIQAGHHLYRLPDGSWRYSTPDERFVRVSGADAVLAAVRDDLYGRARPTADDHDDQAAPLLAWLAGRDALAPAGTADPAPWHVHVAGDGPLADAVTALLAGDRVTRGPVDEGVVAAADVVVACAGWLPDAHWQEVDRWCAAAGVPWHRVHREGARWCLGPYGVPGRDPGYRDLRGRRLAACAAPDELAGLWQALDAGPVPPAPRPGPAEAAVVAGLVVGDLLAARTGRTPPGTGHQVVLDPATGQLTRHRVLPLPATAPAVAVAS